MPTSAVEDDGQDTEHDSDDSLELEAEDVVRRGQKQKNGQTLESVFYSTNGDDSLQVGNTGDTMTEKLPPYSEGVGSQR